VSLRAEPLRDPAAAKALSFIGSWVARIRALPVPARA
jgi:hypothetical protein